MSQTYHSMYISKAIFVGNHSEPGRGWWMLKVDYSKGDFR